MDEAGFGIMAFLMLLLFWILPMFIAMSIWSNKGGSGGIGFLMGFCLGWIGVIIAAVATPSATVAGMVGAGRPVIPAGMQTRDCPHCKQPMRADAAVCLSCQRDSEAWENRDGVWYVTRPSGIYYLDTARKEWVKEESTSAPPS